MAYNIHVKVRDITGQRFGKLVALTFAGVSAGNAKWVCECDCGVKVTVLGNSLRRGLTTSCGCYRIQKTKERNRKHGASIGYWLTPEYIAYRNAKQRCNDPNAHFYHRYGGRGINFNFSSFVQFSNEIGSRPTPLHELDRINNDGHYEPGNVRWVLHRENCRNK